MNNLYIIECDVNRVINDEINKILQDNNFNKEDLITYDLSSNNISVVINELDTYGFFSDRKIVYGSNLEFDDKEIDHDFKSLEKYINNPKMDSILILGTNSLTKKTKIEKLINEKFNIIRPILDPKELIKEKTKDYKISNDTIEYLLINTGEDLIRINNELDKILMYKFDTKEITKNDIDLIVIKKIDDNIFNLIDSIIRKDKKTSLTIYNEIINYGEDVFKLIIVLSDKIRLLAQVKILSNLSDEEICSKIGIKNPKQLYFLRKQISNYSKEELIEYLYKLSLMDEDIKFGKSIDKIAFPMFIASL